MLSALSIQNVVLIEKLDIEFKSGLCALTGETGAGKSILLDSLGLALGARSDAGLVRSGAENAQVSASFDISEKHPAHIILKEADLESDSTLILRRSVSKDGRSKAFINDQPVSVALLKQIGETLLEIHGQFETQGLLDPSTHRALLDEYAGIGVLQSWKTWKDSRSALARMQSEAEEARADEDYLRAAIEDLDALDPKQDEEDYLSGLRERLMNREQVLEALSAADHALNGENDPVRAAWSAIDRIAHKMGEAGEKINAAFDRATAEIQEALSLIQSASADLQESEYSLETIDERLFSLRAQARKHGCRVDDLPGLRAELAAQLNLIEHGDEALALMMKETEAARAAYVKEAKAVSEKRKSAAAKLDKAVASELPPLKLERAKFVTRIEALDEDQWNAEGMDCVRFLVATNPGSEPGALGKIASGGELSRFMLALKVVMAETGAAQTLIFDEVDAGIGGGTADAVGERLARLAAAKQILVVTHSPQVAARAAHHYVVSKGGAKDVKTTVAALPSRQARAEEIARMLAGATITQEARAAADRLLQTGT